jgi:hypothetical protein
LGVAENGEFREALKKAKRYDYFVHKRLGMGDRLWIVVYDERRPLPKSDLSTFGDSKKLLNLRRLLVVFF